MGRRVSLLGALTGLVLFSSLLGGCRPPSADELGGGAVSHLESAGDSALVTWTCTGSPCPWGSAAANHALVWPSQTQAVDARLGYAVSAGIYLPAARATGATISLTSGEAAAYAGQLDAIAHRMLGTINPGQPLQITGLASGEVVSVQADSAFSYALTLVDASTPPAVPPSGPPVVPPSEPPVVPPGDPPVVPPTEPPVIPPTTPPAAVAAASVTWTCIGDPCPWGTLVDGLAIAWPASAHPQTQRLGYAVSPGIYLPGVNANGVTVSVDTGVAGVHAGRLDDPFHRFVAIIGPGESFQIAGIADNEVVSVQGDAPFTYRATAPGTGDPGSAGPVGGPGPGPADPGTPDPGGTPPAGDPPDPGPVVALDAIPAFWRCDSDDCSGDPWTGAVINWPSTAAYPNNARAGVFSRSVFSASGEPLYPYMGSWADGCEVTATAGTVLIIEWVRGTDAWRETLMKPGDTHVIRLSAPEDGAMIETDDAGDIFSVSVRNCTPRPLP